MTLLIIACVLFVVAFVFVVFVVKTKGKNWRLLLASPFLAFTILLGGAFVKVNANEVGVIYHDRYGVLEVVKSEGFQPKSIFEHITKISTTNKTAKVEVYSQTRDSIYAKFQITIIYRIDRINAGLFFRKTGNTDINVDQLNSLIKKSLQAVTTQYDIFDIMGQQLEQNRLDLHAALSADLTTEYFVTLVSVSIDDVDAGDEIEAIIQDKAKAMQQIAIAEQEQARATVEAQTALIVAQNQAAVEIALAQGTAEAQQLLNSVAVSAIQDMYQAQFLTPQSRTDFETSGIGGYLSIQEIGTIVVKTLYYDVWDGVLPTVIADGSGIIINP